MNPTARVPQRRSVLQALGTALGVGVGGIAGCTGQTGETTAEVTVGYKPKFAALQYLVMRQRGYLADRGITVHSQDFAGTDSSIVSAFASGDLDVAFLGVTQALMMVERGVPATGVAANHKNGFVIVADTEFAQRYAETGIEAFHAAAADRGQPVQFTTGPDGGMSNLFVTYWLFEELGLSEDTVQVHPMAGIKAIRRSLISGTATGAALDEPTLTRLANEGAGIEWLVKPTAVVPEQPGGIMIVRNELLETQRAEVRQLVAAHQQATELINTAPEQAAQAAQQAIGESITTATAKQAIRSDAAHYISDPRAVATGTKQFAQYMHAQGHLDSKMDPTAVFSYAPYDAVAE